MVPGWYEILSTFTEAPNVAPKDSAETLYSLPMHSSLSAPTNAVKRSMTSKEIADLHGLGTFELGNRRYLGGKSKLLEFIENAAQSALGRKDCLPSFFEGEG